MDGTRRDIGQPVDPAVEMAVFSGYTGTHCVGYLSIGTPDGMLPYTAGLYIGHLIDLIE